MNTEKICPDISVIVPVYNVEEYLEECLESLRHQGDVSLEVLVIDDGSTDTSGEIADSFAQKSEIFKVFHIENGGLGHARNVGVPLASGKYIFFVDSDDIVPENTFSNMFSLAEHNQTELTICNVARFNSKKTWASVLHKNIFSGVKYYTNIFESPELIYDTTSWNKLILREFYLKNSFSFPENILYEDIPVTIPMHILANKVSVYNEIGYLWRVRDGATMSITQQTSSLKNLNDRIAIISMLDAFFKENVTDEKLILEKEIKALRTDLYIFVNACVNSDKETALEMMKIINDYIDKNVSGAAFEALGVIAKKKYDCVRNYDFETLIKVSEYAKTMFGEEKLSERDDKIFSSLNAELFGTSEGDITDEIRSYQMRIFIDSVDCSKQSFVFHAHAYKSRVSISDSSMQQVRVYLFDVISNERIALPVQYESASELTESVGTRVNPATGETVSYNYDGTGFVFTVNIEDVIKSGCHDGKHKIIVEYNSKYYSGAEILMGASKFALTKEESCLVSDTYTLRLNYLNMNEVCLTLTGNNVFAEVSESSDETVSVITDADITELYALSTGGKKICFTKNGDAYEAKCEDFKKSKEYTFFAVTTKGEVKEVLSESKKIKTIPCTDGYIVYSSLKTRVLTFIITGILTEVRTHEVNENVLCIETRVPADNIELVEKCDRAELFVHDVIAGKKVMLAHGNCRKTNAGNLSCKFKIDFSKNRINKNFYESERQIFIRYFKGDDVVCENSVISEKNFNESFEIDTLKIKATRAKSGELFLILKQKWRENEDSFQKRKILRTIRYPEFCKEPINPKQIVFESMWGTKYSCNCQALYEYIDKYHPEYECIWLFTDERTPIKGKGIRVRRGSEDYWHYLATAKYFVNNVNFETAYVKREGQVHIQTMHGTPLKTLGLDVKADFPTPKSVESYIEKCNRWDYLIVQGKFMKKKAMQCFRFNRKMLKTGYPRTDALYSIPQEKIDKIRKELELPEGKKIILYAPTWRVKNKFDMKLDIEKMRERLSDEYILLVRLHHLCSAGYKIPADGKFVFDLNEYRYVDDLFLISDILITDYSSVMFDYALLNKPMIFFTYDFESYCEDLRGLYVDFKAEAPGPMLSTSDEVISTIENLDEEMKKCQGRIKYFKKKYLTYETDKSCEKVVKKVLGVKKKK